MLFRSEKKRSAALIKAAFELRMMTLSGYMPDVAGCCACDDDSISSLRFCISSGRSYCKKCSCEEETVLMDEGITAAVRHIVYCPAGQLFSFSLSDEGEKALGEVAEGYANYHIQRRLKSLDFYQSVND